MSLQIDRTPTLRYLTSQQRRDNVPFQVVWEMTLACNLKCGHCGSRAGKRRPGELTTPEALDLVEQMARLGVRELSIIGGEAHLRKDWLEIIRHATSLGIGVGMQTGGYNLSFKKLQQAKDAGLVSVGLSVDGLAKLHDRVRGVAGSFDHAIRSLRYAYELGLVTGVNTQIGPETPRDLPELVDILIAEKVGMWRCQLTAPMGNAVDNDNLLLQPYELAEVLPLIGRLYVKARENGMMAEAGNNIGFFGPTESLLRPISQWVSCGAGQNVLALEADGTVKSCPSLATSSFSAGNIRETSLHDIWHTSDLMQWARLRTTKDLWGFCGACYFKEACYAGCTWMGHSLFGKTGNNPWCEYRVHELAKQGLRERVVKIAEAPEDPFAIGGFELRTEPLPGRESRTPLPAAVQGPPGRSPLVQIQLGRESGGKLQPVFDHTREPAPGRVVKRVKKCGSCGVFMLMREDSCPECGSAMPEWRRQQVPGSAVQTAAASNQA